MSRHTTNHRHMLGSLFARTSLVIALAAGAVGLTACRGWTSDKPPVHLNPNMDTQEKLKPFRESDFFADGRSMRAPVAGTVARGLLKEDDLLYRGEVGGQPATVLPAQLEASEATVKRGQQRYNIYCAPCHAQHGTGEGTVAARLAVKPPSFHDERLLKMPIGKIFHAISNGVNNGNMPAYNHQIPETDRWAISLYVRALQKAHNPSADIPLGGVAEAAAAATPSAPAVDDKTKPATPATDAVAPAEDDKKGKKGNKKNPK